MKVALTGGGTLGHVIPALSVYDEIRRLDPSVEAFFIGGIFDRERMVVERTGLCFLPISTGKLRRYFTPKNISDMLRVVKGYFQARRILAERRPDVLFSKGGFVSVPVVAAASSLGIRIVTHESDFSMGLANRLNARLSDLVCLSFPSDKVDGLRYVLTGNPVRRDVAALAGRHVEQERDLVLVLGGSQGASQINDLVYSGLERLCPRYSVVHQCGSHGDMTRSAVRYRQVEFIDEELPDLMARARVVVSRAGANAIAEICTLGKCSLLVPLTHATRGDQVENAASLESRGACRVYRDGDDFVDLVVSLMEDDALNEGISKAAIAEGRGDAAGHIARIVLGVANGQRNTDRLAEPFTR